MKRAWMIILAAAVAVNVLAAEPKIADVKTAEAKGSEPRAAESRATNLDQLLEAVRKTQTEGSELNRKREAEFRAARDQQVNLLRQAQSEISALESEAASLQKQFDANDEELARLDEAKNQRVGKLGELFAVVRQMAGDTAARMGRSVVSAQFPGRERALEAMAQAEELPNLDQLRTLWISLQQEMTEQGKVARFNTQVVKGDGASEQRAVIRIGGFNLISNGDYLVYSPETKQVQELVRQPVSRIHHLVGAFENHTSGLAPLYVDPSKGAMLTAVVQSPSLTERFHQGAVVGYVITLIFIVGVAIVIERLVTLGMIGSKIKLQMKNPTPGDNPLGRIMSVYLANKNAKPDNLELKIDEAIMKELPALDRGIAMVKVFAALAPLLGLLGTVTGMIETLQVITTFGTGDPKMMASGISMALVTTVQGIVTAIPLLFLHSVIQTKSRSLLHVLEEQSVGLMALHLERKGA